MQEQRSPVQGSSRKGLRNKPRRTAQQAPLQVNGTRCGAADTDAGSTSLNTWAAGPVRGQQRREGLRDRSRSTRLRAPVRGLRRWEGLRERPRCRVSGAGPPPAVLGRDAPSWRASPSWASWAFCVFRAAPEERDGPDVPDDRGGREAAAPREADGADGDAPDGSRRRRRRARPAPAATCSRICVS